MNLINKLRLLFQKDRKPYIELYNILGFYPKNIEYYRTALMHKSCKVRNHGHSINNERLEFLGDAILGAVVADILYERYDNKQEGYLTNLRSKLVKRETLNKLAVQIGLNKLIHHTGNVQQAHNSYVNGNAFEALFGAIYLDQGYDFCKTFMKERIFKTFVDIEQTAKKEENFKSRLIEWCQKYQLSFDFRITGEQTDQDGTTPKFYSEVIIEGVSCGKGVGYTKKESHQKAALNAMKLLRHDVQFVNRLFELRKKNATKSANS